MPVVEARFGELAFPPCCCSCGSRAFKLRTHTEKVVMWTVISVTRYRIITLKIPACDSCAMRPWLWFGGAAALIGLVCLYVTTAGHHGRDVGMGVLFPLVAALAMVIKGQASKPLRILAFDGDDQMIQLKIHDAAVARQMLRQRAHYEGDRKLVRRPLMIGLGIVGVAMMLMLLVLARHPGA